MLGRAGFGSRLALLELARVFVCFDHVASFIVNAGDGVMWAGRKTRLPSRYFCPEAPAPGGWPPRLCESDGSRPELGDGKLVGGRL